MNAAVKCLLAATVGWMTFSCRGALVINEVCYDNSKTADETGDTSSDWIELYNRGPEAVNVANYGVADANPYQESKGVRLPDYTLPAGGYLVVFASGDIPEHTAWVDAPDLQLVGANVSWRYRSERTAPDDGWEEVSFDDGSWPSGIAPLGYNDAKASMDCATVLDYGADPNERYTTAYFRSRFSVIDPAVVTGLVVHARMDDGWVLYLNGKEVLRQNMPTGAVSFATWALSSVPSTQWSSALLPSRYLIQGTNVLAVEVHQALAASPDLIMDMTLTGLVSERIPVVHGQFKLANEGENIHLFNADLVRVQLFAPPGAEIGEDKSYGALPDGSTTSFAIFDHPTPGFSNATHTNRYFETLTSQKPLFSAAPGVYPSEQTVTLRTPTAGYRIYYTLDGTDPRDSSAFVMSGGSVIIRAAEAETNGLAWIRTNPLEIGNQVLAAAWRPPVGAVTRATVLRAVAVDADGNECSPETCGSYLIGENFQNNALPVVSLITNPENLFGFTQGIYVPGKTYADSAEGYGDNKWGKPYANYFQSNSNQAWERAVFFEWREPTQNLPAVALTLGAAVSGGSARALPQKSVQLLARAKEYGTNQVEYAFFPKESATAYKRLLLSNGGDDWYGVTSGGVPTLMKDGVFQEIVKDMDLSVMAYRPSVVYVNGEYWGLHNLSESCDKFYFATRYGLDPDNIDLLQQDEDAETTGDVDVTVASGNATAGDDYRTLLAWVATNGLSGSDNYLKFQTQADVTNYTDYVIAETFYANTEWPLNNGLFWRAHTNQTATAGAYGDTRWRWIFNSVDRAGEEGSDFNMFAYLSADGMKDVNQPGFLINALWANAAYRDFFVLRYERMLNTFLRPSRTSEILWSAADEIANEVETHFRRWGRTYTQDDWKQAVDETLIRFASERYAVTWGQLNDKFGLGGSGILEVRNANGAGAGGHFRVDGLDIEETTPGVTNRASWSGTFFQNRPIAIEAVPDPGYVLSGWDGRSETGAVLLVTATDEAQCLVAHFLRTDAIICQVTFAADGGTVTPPHKTVVVGEAYGGLPIPTRAGYTFDGWWTGEDGSGTRVTESDLVVTATDHVLHAKWDLSVPSGQKTTVGVVFALSLPDAFGTTGRVTVVGLPAGLKYDSSTRTITGVATRPGIYSNVVITAANGLKETITLAVSALPSWAQGAFNGYLGSDSGGLASMNVTAAGKTTGKLTLGGTRYSFTSAAYSSMTEDGSTLMIDATAKAGKTTVPVSFQVSQLISTGSVSSAQGVASGYMGGTGGVPLLMYRNVWGESGAATLLARYAGGYYTATLADKDSGAECGSGFLTITADKKGNVKLAGLLADGTSVALSAPLILDEMGQVFAVVYLSPLLYRGGSVFGLAQFQTSADGGITLNPLDHEAFLWTSSNPKATGIYGDGFSRSLWLTGGWYNRNDTLYAYYAGKTLTGGADSHASPPKVTVGTNTFSSVWWNPTGIAVSVVTNKLGIMTGLAGPQPVSPVRQADGSYDYTAGNTVGLKIRLTRETGLFKGSFKVWFDYQAKPTAKNVLFSGVLTPERDDSDDGVEGRGFFLWTDKGEYMSEGGKKMTYSFNRSYDLFLSSD